MVWYNFLGEEINFKHWYHSKASRTYPALAVGRLPVRVIETHFAFGISTYTVPSPHSPGMRSPRPRPHLNLSNCGTTAQDRILASLGKEFCSLLAAPPFA